MKFLLLVTVVSVLFGCCLNFEEAVTDSEKVVQTVTKEMVKLSLAQHTRDSALLRLVDDDCFLCKQLKCITLEEPCTHFLGETFKSVAPLVLKNNCKNCSPTEQDLVRITTLYISQHFPNEWKKILELYTSD
ncbi:Hypothetical predicted protein [Cloeon dipterum]|uniref:Uncharacterized protein n=1 Tax=Cloeon dipterum TaxID=197152 RepID=A0A8S1CZ22_9INSE|nr:Hypothetical predicted protein [Cloeon dipterum]